MNFSLRTQFAIIVLASVAMLSLAAFLIRDAVSQTESQRIEDAQRQVTAACEELRLQYDEREAFVAEEGLDPLPPESQEEEASLKFVSETVLRAYEEVRGGFYLRSGKVRGASGGDLTAEVENLIANVAQEAFASNGPAGQVREQGLDTIVAAAVPVASGTAAAWSVRHLTGLRDPLVRRQRWTLAALIFSALLGMAAVISVWYSLHAGVNAVRSGLGRLEKDFHYQLPEGHGDFGQIASAINHMAGRRLALETELRRQDRLAALGKAVAGVAHEIRNPLNSLKLSLELLNRRLAKGKATGEETMGASGEVDRLDRIVGRLLAFGRPALADRRVQDLTPLVEQAVQMVREQARRKEVSIQVERPDEEPPKAYVDGPQLQQVLINLLLNAIEASPQGETVTVVLSSSADAVSIQVTDRGSGIPEEARSHVFDVYFTTKPDGVGLGLSVSREIVVNHGGTLEFSSCPGRTEFVIAIPGKRIPASEKESASTHRRG